jgi:hypothetical protein
LYKYEKIFKFINWDLKKNKKTNLFSWMQFYKLKDFTLSYDYHIFSIFILFSVILSSTVFFYFSNAQYQKEVLDASKRDVEAVDVITNSLFQATNNIMVYIGKQIAKNENRDLSFIRDLFSHFSNVEYRHARLISSSRIFWINVNNYAVVHSKTGIVEKTFDISHRCFIPKNTDDIQKNAWKLRVCPPDHSLFDDAWVIPAGAIIVDNKNNYIGCIALGFYTQELKAKIIQARGEQKTKFLIIDENYNLIIQSKNSEEKLYNLKNLFNLSEIFSHKSGILKNPIIYNNTSYMYFKKMENFPYIILSGFDNFALKREMYNITVPRIIEFLFFSLFCVVLLYTFRRRLVVFFNLSFKAKEDYVNSLISKINEKIYVDINNFKKIILNDLKDSTIGNNKGKHLETINKISDLFSDALSPSSKKSRPTYVDVSSLLSTCLSVHSQSAFIKRVSLKGMIPPYLPPLYIDEFHFKQIIIGMLEISIQQTPSCGKIRLYASVEEKEGCEYLKIDIIDNGFGLNNEDMLRISPESKGRVLQGFNFYCSFPHIEAIVRIYGGTCAFKSAWKKGRTSTVWLPYSFQKLANKGRYVNIHPIGATIN